MVTMVVTNQRILNEHAAICKTGIAPLRNKCHFTVNACKGIVFHTGITIKCARVKAEAKQ